jgi:hypothetical protein
MIWPSSLVSAALLNTLHAQETAGTHASDGISRGRFFIYVFIGYFFYSQLSLRPGGFTFLTIRFMSDFFPSYLFTALSSFSWVCWIAPNNVKVNQMFGVTHGLGMGLLTFDWGQIAFCGSPFVVPFWAAANIGFTIVFFYWILVPILYVCSHFFQFFFSEHTHAVHQRMV